MLANGTIVNNLTTKLDTNLFWVGASRASLRTASACSRQPAGPPRRRAFVRTRHLLLLHHLHDAERRDKLQLHLEGPFRRRRDVSLLQVPGVRRFARSRRARHPLHHQAQTPDPNLGNLSRNNG